MIWFVTYLFIWFFSYQFFIYIYATIVQKIDIFSDLVTRKSKWRQTTSFWLQNGITSNIKKSWYHMSFLFFFWKKYSDEVSSLQFTYKSWYNNFNFAKVWFFEGWSWSWGFISTFDKCIKLKILQYVVRQTLLKSKRYLNYKIAWAKADSVSPRPDRM